MAKRKKSRGGKPKHEDRHLHPRVSFHLPEELDDALQAFIDTTRPTPGKSAVLRLALEELLERRGLWPPPDKPG